jgi:two-component system cell cycle response regulator CtrA
VTISGNLINLTYKEYTLLEVLALKKGLIVFKNAILRHLYKDQEEPDKKIIDVLVCKIRNKFKQGYSADCNIKVR